MATNHKNSPNNSLHKKTCKATKIEALKKYVATNKYIDIEEQPKICAQFGLPPMPSIFRLIYRERFFEFLTKEPTTVATVERKTGIPHKYLTECKAYYEKKGLLKELAIGICPTTKSRNVQFVSTNQKHWDSFQLPNECKQLKLWEGENE